MTRTMDRMSALDAEFFYAEHGSVPMHIGSVAVFDGPAPTRQDLMRAFEAKLPRVPRYRQAVRTTPFQLLRPVWADDQDFSIRHHVRYSTVPAPGGPDQLRAAAAKLFSVPLVRGRPLWEEWLLDGLQDGRWAIVSKIHHCMVDGIGGNDLMAAVFDTAADARRRSRPTGSRRRAPRSPSSRPMTCATRSAGRCAGWRRARCSSLGVRAVTSGSRIGGQPGPVFLLGQHLIKRTLEPGTGRGLRSLPIEERDGAFQLAAVVAQFECCHGVHRVLGRLDVGRFGRHRQWSSRGTGGVSSWTGPRTPRGEHNWPPGPASRFRSCPAVLVRTVVCRERSRSGATASRTPTSTWRPGSRA